ncbi:MAG: FmdE family protein [Bacteroidales bacterium]|nr:FmdE family protein [Bacteroidales bacterium]
MKYPDFFDKVKTIKVKDELSGFLGTFEEGIIEYSYTEIVKAAGHSCPTVAGAYIMCAKALEKLYPDNLPIRGQIKVEFKNSITEGVTGVISNVISHITGATAKSGFKGIAGNFARHSLLSFDAEIKGEVRFTRTDNNAFADVIYNPVIPPKEEMQMLMQKSISGQASKSEKNKFSELWQARVEEIIINNFDNPEVVIFI